MNQLELTADQCVFVGDHIENDIIASKRVELKAIWKNNTTSDVEVEADVVIENLNEIPTIIENWSKENE